MVPVSAVKRRCSVRGAVWVVWASSASAQGRVISARTVARSSSNSTPAFSCGRRRTGTYCACPPWRAVGSTIERATVAAAAAPWATACNARHRSMPALTPADVHTVPETSRVCSTLGRTRIRGVSLGQQLARRPVRCRHLTVEQPGGRQHERTGTQRGHLRTGGVRDEQCFAHRQAAGLLHGLPQVRQAGGAGYQHQVGAGRGRQRHGI